LAAVGAAIAATGVAFASPGQQGAQPQIVDNVSSAQAASFSVQNAEDYWTPQRMEEAIKAGPSESSVTERVTTTEVANGPSAAIDGVQPGEITTQDIHSMTGRVFFVDDHGENHSCSGSTVNSPGKHLVFTAG